MTLEVGEEALVRTEVLNNALRDHPDPQINQQHIRLPFDRTGHLSESLRRKTGAAGYRYDEDRREHRVRVLEVQVPYGTRGHRVGVRVRGTLRAARWKACPTCGHQEPEVDALGERASDDTDVETVVHQRAVHSVVKREVHLGLREYVRDAVLAEVAQNANPTCDRCSGRGRVLSDRAPCPCTGVNLTAFLKMLDEHA